MKHLDANYPAVTKGMALWFIPVVALLVIVVLALSLGVEVDNPAVAILVSVLAGVAIVGISLGGFLYQYKTRSKVRDGVLAANPNYAVRTEAGFLQPIVVWANKFVGLRAFQRVVTAINRQTKVRRTGSVPYIFITLKRPGTVKWKWGNVEKRARGISQGSWCEIDWYDEFPKRTTALALHEMAHSILTYHNPGMTTSDQHQLMRDAGVEQLLKEK